MVYRNFDQLLEQVKNNPNKARVAIAGAADEHVMESVIEAEKLGIAVPVLIGNTDDIVSILATLGCSAESYRIIQADTPTECGIKAVEEIKAGNADFIMKGMVDTKDVLKPLVNKENNLHTGRTMSHVVIDEIPAFNRLTVMTDGGMIPYPTLEDKKDIIINAVEVLHKLGYTRPSVAVLAAVEKVNPKMVETTDAAALAKMSQTGEIKNCDIVGPISFDIAANKEIAQLKKFDCPYCGDFDIMVTPNMVSGNLMNKAIILCGGAKMAGIIVGAKVPVVLTSRGSSAEEKFMSLALASLVSGGK